MRTVTKAEIDVIRGKGMGLIDARNSLRKKIIKEEIETIDDDFCSNNSFSTIREILLEMMKLI